MSLFFLNHKARKKLKINIYIYIYIYMLLEKKTTNKLQLHPYKPVSRITHSSGDLNRMSDERFGAKLRVTENRCVVFDFSTYVCFALLPQHIEHFMPR